MAADNVETAFCLPSGVNEDFARNLKWQHNQQQQNQENINQQKQQNNNQFTSPLTTPAVSETSFGNAFDETEENCFDHISMVYIKKLFFTRAGKKLPENPFQNMSTIMISSSHPLQMLKSSRLQMFFILGTLKNFAILTGKHLCWSLFFFKSCRVSRDSNTGVFL